MNSGDIVLVKFPFSDLATSKKRPALVLTSTKISPKVSLCIIAMITSRVDGPRIKGDFLIKNQEEAGLLYPSLVRFAKVATVEGELVDKKIGSLSKADFNSAKKQFEAIFKRWT